MSEVILLWGEVGVGKTTLLASGLLKDRRHFPEIDWTRSTDVEKDLVPIWRNLRKNVRPGGTTQKHDLQITMTDGETVTFIDVPGGWSRNTATPEVQQLIDRATAVLFVMEWDARERGLQFAAMDDIVHRLPAPTRARTGLAFTKCERVMAAGDDVWRKASEEPSGRWWQRRLLWTQDELKALNDLPAVWATSVYGFSEETRRPACILDEFGDVFPFRIAPRNVSEVMSWYLKGGEQ